MKEKSQEAISDVYLMFYFRQLFLGFIQIDYQSSVYQSQIKQLYLFVSFESFKCTTISNDLHA